MSWRRFSVLVRGLSQLSVFVGSLQADGCIPGAPDEEIITDPKQGERLMLAMF